MLTDSKFLVGVLVGALLFWGYLQWKAKQAK